MKVMHTFSLLVTIMLLYACGPAEKPGKTGFTLRITDAPLDFASSVVLDIRAIEMQPAGGEMLRLELETPAQINLLDYPGSTAMYLFKNETVPSGKYDWMRLIVETQSAGDSYVTQVQNGIYSTHELHLAQPEGLYTGSFSLADAGVADMTIDVDLRKSLALNNGLYTLYSHIRLVDNRTAAHIGGQVNDALISVNDCATSGAVYVYSGLDAVPEDVCLGETCTAAGPVSSSLVGVGSAGGNYYEIGFLPLGDYTIAYTCDAHLDDPLVNDISVGFIDTKNLSLETANVVELINF